MQMETLLQTIRKHPRFQDAGMILCHNGVVRGTSRDGRAVSGLRVHVDHARLEAVLAAGRRLPGIVDIQIVIAENRLLTVGEDVMLLVVAGDFRENVIAALEQTLNAVKTTVTHKTEFYR
jgi:molybdopterin synthase catalytic subunit